MSTADAYRTARAAFLALVQTDEIERIADRLAEINRMSDGVCPGDDLADAAAAVLLAKIALRGVCWHGLRAEAMSGHLAGGA